LVWTYPVRETWCQRGEGLKTGVCEDVDGEGEKEKIKAAAAAAAAAAEASVMVWRGWFYIAWSAKGPAGQWVLWWRGMSGRGRRE